MCNKKEFYQIQNSKPKAKNKLDYNIDLPYLKFGTT